MKIEDHLRNINESLDVIKESVEKGLQKRQRTIGFSMSVASVEMLEVFLHKEKLLDLSSMLKHDWFSSVKRANDKVADFSDKNKVIELLNKIESKRNILCYGKTRTESEIRDVLNSFYKIKKFFEDKGLKWN